MQVIAAEAIGQRADVRQPDAFARLVLLPGAAEQVEHAVVVVRRDAAAVVHDLDDDARPLDAGGDDDRAPGGRA